MKRHATDAHDAGTAAPRVAEPGLADSRVAELAEHVVREAGLELVECVQRGAAGSRLLRIAIDRAGPQGVDLADCERVSRELSARLDEADLIPSRYVLEVSSPGVDRPIRSDDDIRRNTGRRIVVTTREPVQGSCTHHGRLLGTHNDHLLLESDDHRRVEIPQRGIVAAHQEAEL